MLNFCVDFLKTVTIFRRCVTKNCFLLCMLISENICLYNKYCDNFERRSSSVGYSTELVIIKLLIRYLYWVLTLITQQTLCVVWKTSTGICFTKAYTGENKINQINNKRTWFCWHLRKWVRETITLCLSESISLPNKYALKPYSKIWNRSLTSNSMRSLNFAHRHITGTNLVAIRFQIWYHKY